MLFRSDIVIDKGIPFSQGLGGSSADASATIYCLAKMQGVCLCDAKIKQVCDSVGSDVYFMLHGGLGKIVDRSQMVKCGFAEMFGCLVTFKHQSDTAAIFRQYDKFVAQQMTDNDSLLAAILSGDLVKANQLCFNALQQPSRALNCYADNFINSCQTLGVKPTMTGSGSAYFVLCENKQKAEELASLLGGMGFSASVFQSVSSGIVEI